MSKGYVYVLSNPLMPGLVKIGKTTRDVNSRAGELYQTGVPAPFKVEHQVSTPDCHELERKIHKELGAHRVDPGREFFEMDPKDAADFVDQELYQQVGDWLNEFLPDHEAVHVDESVDPSSLHFLAHQMGGKIDVVIGALPYLRPEELRPAMQRRERRELPYVCLASEEVAK